MRWIVYISLLFIVACSTAGDDAELAVSSIASLRNIDSYNRTTLITSNIYLEGRVVANDAYGEFYKRLIIQDDSGGVEILCDSEEIYRYYPIGARVCVSCSGLYFANFNGQMQLGSAPTADYTQGYISSSKIGQYLKIATSDEQLTPAKVSIAQISALDISTLVALEDVEIVSSFETFCTIDIESGKSIDTEHKVVDSAGKSIVLTVNRNCTYAENPLPSGKGLLYAIVGYENGYYTITISDSVYIF